MDKATSFCWFSYKKYSAFKWKLLLMKSYIVNLNDDFRTRKLNIIARIFINVANKVKTNIFEKASRQGFDTLVFCSVHQRSVICVTWNGTPSSATLTLICWLGNNRSTSWNNFIHQNRRKCARLRMSFQVAQLSEHLCAEPNSQVRTWWPGSFFTLFVLLSVSKMNKESRNII